MELRQVEATDSCPKRRSVFPPFLSFKTSQSRLGIARSPFKLAQHSQPEKSVVQHLRGFYYRGMLSDVQGHDEL
jgi:hypothetical protein